MYVDEIGTLKPMLMKSCFTRNMKRLDFRVRFRIKNNSNISRITNALSKKIIFIICTENNTNTLRKSQRFFLYYILNKIFIEILV